MTHASRVCILRVAINTPLRRLFDYLPPPESGGECIYPGQRVLVPFGKNRSVVGLVAEITKTTQVPPRKLKHIVQALDPDPLFKPDHLEFLLWTAQYYQHPPGEVILGNLPQLLRSVKPATPSTTCLWRLTPAGKSLDLNTLKRAPRQQAIIRHLRNHGDGLAPDEIRRDLGDSLPALRALAAKQLVERYPANMVHQHIAAAPTRPIALNQDQERAVNAITSVSGHFQPFLLNGVTGSGKTEVYLRCIEHILSQGRQALVLLPEIGLTPQLLERFTQRLQGRVAVLHSALTATERLRSWFMARDGEAHVIMGTRSALWAPCKHLGIVVVDEEHDPSFKQQDGFRYSARDMALVRARRENIPVVLGSATPSLESMHNVAGGRYLELRLPQRAGGAHPPHIRMMDMRACAVEGALSLPLLEAIRVRLARREQVILFLNRRGYAPVLMCHDCGWTWRCPRCEIQMNYHKQDHKLRCHHCGHEEGRNAHCPGCGGGQIMDIGHGTQRLTETLVRHFPTAGILRIDRDSTRRKGSLQSMMTEIRHGRAAILIGTQILAKGHHFPDVTLAGIIDADRGLYSMDFRASERMGQIIMQVSGRAGRAEKPGEVLIQTYHPDHPLLLPLQQHDYESFTTALLRERKEAMLPPYTHLALLRAEAAGTAGAGKFLQAARSRLPQPAGGIEILGPVASPMEKRAGHYRMQMLLQAQNRNRLRALLDEWVPALEHLPEARRVRWSLDVDPQDLF